MNTAIHYNALELRFELFEMEREFRDEDREPLTHDFLVQNCRPDLVTHPEQECQALRLLDFP
ncbi:MAG TPA: hypothetical protein VFT72_00630 [Opitutaceae bacterium]|nr:hypothetical protein [Opitutaceae bacterium]